MPINSIILEVLYHVLHACSSEFQFYFYQLSGASVMKFVTCVSAGHPYLSIFLPLVRIEFRQIYIQFSTIQAEEILYFN